MGIPTYSSEHASTHSQEEHYGPHHRLLPQWELPCQRANRQRQYRYPFAQGTAVRLPRVPQNLQRHHRHGLLSAAHCGRDRGPHCDLARPWVPRARDWAAFGFDERTRADWWASPGGEGQAVHAYLVEQPRDLGQVQADELRVKKQGGIVWMALAMMVKTRVWLGGEVSEQRDMPLIRRLIERVRRCAAHRPLVVCTDGFVSYIRAMRETLRDPIHPGTGGRPRLRPWRNVLVAQVIKRYERRRVVETERRIIDGTPARVETLRRRSQGEGVINTAYIERLNATLRERLASLTRRGRALARHTLTLEHGMYLVGTVYNFCMDHASLRLTAAAAGTAPRQR